MGRTGLTDAVGGGSSRRPARTGAVALCALALAVFGCGGGGGGGSDSVITVNDADFRGVAGDTLLSLSEAIELATGRRLLRDLTLPEQAQVEGTPGFGLHDVIRFERSLRTIDVRRTTIAAAAVLPVLDDEGDSIDGDGIVLSARLMAGEPQPGLEPQLLLTDEELLTVSAAPLLRIEASGVRVAGLTIEEFPGTVILVAGQEGRDGTQQVEIRDNAIGGLGQNSVSAGIAAVAAAGSNDRLIAGVEISGNVVEDVSSGIVVSAGAASGSGQAARFNRVEGARIRGNRIERCITGIAAFAAEVSAGAQASDNLLRDIEITANEVVSFLDAGIRTATTYVLNGGATSDNQVSGVRITDNTIGEPPGGLRRNFGMSHSTGRVIARGSSADDIYDDLTLERNVVTGFEFGVFLAAADAERCGDGCDLTGNSLERVTLRGNSWGAGRFGVVIAAGSATEAAALVRENFVRDVQIDGDVADVASVGIVLAAGWSEGLEPGGAYLASNLELPGVGRAGQVRDNVLRQVTIRNSDLAASTGIAVAGGIALDTDDDVSRSTTEDVDLIGNRIIASDMRIVGGLVSESGTVRDCLVDGVDVSANQNNVGLPVALAILDQSAEDGAPLDSVRGNRVQGVRRD